jgi:transcriptional regulator with XRE-family HTH domain
MLSDGTRRHNQPLNGVQVVGGSNPPTPTINLASKLPLSCHNVAPRLCLENTFAHTGVYQTLSSSSLKEINRCQQKLGLSDRTVARLLGISVTYLSLLKHGKRPISAVLMRHIHDLNPQDVTAAVEVLPRKPALVCMETNSNANLTPVRQVVERFLIAKQLEGCAKDTIRFYRDNLRWLLCPCLIGEQTTGNSEQAG